MRDMNLHDRFEAVNSEFLKFERVEKPLHRRPDLCAFLLIDQITNGKPRDMVCAAEHDQIYLDADMEEMQSVITDEDILTPVRCAVVVENNPDSLPIFVYPIPQPQNINAGAGLFT